MYHSFLAYVLCNCGNNWLIFVLLTNFLFPKGRDHCLKILLVPQILAQYMAFSGLNTFILDEWGRGKASNRVRK